MIKYIVFDFDGTIANTFEVVCEEGNRILARYNIVVDPEEARLIGLKKIIFKSKFPITDIPKCLTELRRNIRSRVVNDVKTFPGMTNVIKELSSKYTLAVVSSNAEANIKGFLDNNGLRQYFKIIYSDSSLFGKQRVIIRLCNKYQIDRKELVYIGDEDRDVQATKRIKVKSIAVTWGYNTQERLRDENPDALVSEVPELVTSISKLSMK